MNGSTTSSVCGAPGRSVTTITAAILLCTLAGAQSHKTGGTRSSGGPNQSATHTVDLSPKNKLHFPYGVQSFERSENIKVGNALTTLPGWQMLSAGGVVSALVTENPNGLSRPGTRSKRWLSVEDFGAGLNDGFISPSVRAPAPWDYAWSFGLMVETAPAGGDAPVLAVQHDGSAGFQDAWGVRLTATGAELFMNESWGTPTVVPLFTYSGTTDVGEWIQLRIVASVEDDTLTAFVNGTQVAFLRTRTPATTDVTNVRLSYHGNGTGNVTSLLLDDVGVAFLDGVCEEPLNLDFTTEDDLETVLVNGQDISTAPEFGNKVAVNGIGARGAAIFDSSDPGPNNPSQDLDLLVNQGNILIIQNDSPNNPPAVGGIFPRPNDDEDGGTLVFNYIRPVKPQSLDLVDIDGRPEETVVISLTDFSSLTRVYTVPPDWTGDITQSEPGVGTLDLTSIAAQAGFNSVATAVEDLDFDPNAVMMITVAFGGSGGLDNLNVIIPCVELTFEGEDDGTPDSPATPLANGQDLSTPPEFGVEVALSDAGPNVGAAIFDSTPGGPNDPGPDNDLLVGLGNILILQNDLASLQTVPGFFDVPNDDTNGGTLFFSFPGPVECHRMDLIDVDEEEAVGVTVTLTDSSALTRTFTVPPSWTEDRLNDGPPAFRTLDLETLAPQPGFVAVATAVEDPGFDPDDVVMVTVSFGGAQAMDNFCFCP